ncbi:MAG: methionine--tRNA ligase [candidate division SR1 bacterium]|nr:methionine--tRNA ligase [candidate division SR1 bacterium]
MKKFLITTPIYYPNGYPHIGHAYSSFIADFFARYKRLLGYEVKFSTGNDENSQKIVQQAQAEGKDIMEYLNEMGQKREGVWKHLQISYTDFIRTTQENHKHLVQEMLQKSYDKGDIYEGEYKGYYCVGCEGFKTEKDLIEKNGALVCPDHLTKPDVITEKNRFFKLKNYQAKIENFYKKCPEFLLPEYRFNEMKSFVNGGLEDFSVSRETNKFGIPLPFDLQQVSYVRYDALFNYVTVSRESGFRDNNTQIVHILGKDIARFHSIFWPAMLMSVEYRLPDTEFVTGFFTVDGQKMSKSLGNVIDPVKVVDDYDRDALIFNLLYDVPIGADGDFSVERLGNLYESMLIGGRGNLVNRVTSLCKKYGITAGKINKKKREVFKENNNSKLVQYFEDGWDGSKIEEAYLKKADIKGYLDDWYQLVQRANEYITHAEPWIKYKNEMTKDDAIADLQFLLYIVKNIALFSAPILVNGFKKIQAIFGNEEFSEINSEVNNANSPFKVVFDMEDFPVNLDPKIIYQKKEEEKKL